MVGHLAQMRSGDAAPPERCAGDPRSGSCRREPSRGGRGLARGSWTAAADSVSAVIFFGSRKSRARPDPYSAYDFFVVVRDYRAVLRPRCARRRAAAPPALLAGLNAVLPPNLISLTAGAGGARPRAKCAVVSRDHVPPRDLARRGATTSAWAGCSSPPSSSTRRDEAAREQVAGRAGAAPTR